MVVKKQKKGSAPCSIQILTEKIKTIVTALEILVLGLNSSLKPAGTDSQHMWPKPGGSGFLKAQCYVC